MLVKFEKCDKIASLDAWSLTIISQFDETSVNALFHPYEATVDKLALRKSNISRLEQPLNDELRFKTSPLIDCKFAFFSEEQFKHINIIFPPIVQFCQF